MTAALSRADTGSGPMSKKFKNIMVLGLAGIGLVASSAAVVNHIADAHIDKQMARTQDRPVATGRLGAVQGMTFSAVIGIAGMLS